MEEKIEFEGKVGKVWDFGYYDIIGFHDIGGEYHCLHFDKGFLSTRFPRNSRVKVTVALIEGKKTTV